MKSPALGSEWANITPAGAWEPKWGAEWDGSWAPAVGRVRRGIRRISALGEHELAKPSPREGEGREIDAQRCIHEPGVEVGEIRLRRRRRRASSPHDREYSNPSSSRKARASCFCTTTPPESAPKPESRWSRRVLAREQADGRTASVQMTLPSGSDSTSKIGLLRDQQPLVEVGRALARSTGCEASRARSCRAAVATGRRACARRRPSRRGEANNEGSPPLRSSSTSCRSWVDQVS